MNYLQQNTKVLNEIIVSIIAEMRKSEIIQNYIIDKRGYCDHNTFFGVLNINIFSKFKFPSKSMCIHQHYIIISYFHWENKIGDICKYKPNMLINTLNDYSNLN